MQLRKHVFQLLIHNKVDTISFKYKIILFGLIQSQAKTRATSASTGNINTNVLTLVFSQLFASCF